MTHPAIASAVAAAGASEAAAAAAQARFDDWLSCAEDARVRCPRRLGIDAPPTAEEVAARIVDACIWADRDGCLERPIGARGRYQSEARLERALKLADASSRRLDGDDRA